MESNHDFSADYNLLCTENREFLYELTDGRLRHGVDPDLDLNVDKTFASSNMAEHGEIAIQNATAHDTLTSPQTNSSRKRKRNSVKDKLRAEAEQNAYKKLKQIIPSLRGCKRVTKLETIRQACLYIEKLQQTLTGIRG